ncbi:MAG: NYN domain-containing protein, partial [Rhodococcus sp. (in: high G+C Gram-positive bacteria)]
MSFNEELPDTTLAPIPNLDTSDSPHSKRVLLVWDAPNLDMGLGAILGGRPTAAYRPRFDALGRWLLQRTAELSVTESSTLEPEATGFTNNAPRS